MCLGPTCQQTHFKKQTATAHLEGKDVCGDGLSLQGFPCLQLQLVHCSLASPTGSLEAAQQNMGVGCVPEGVWNSQSIQSPQALVLQEVVRASLML